MTMSREQHEEQAKAYSRVVAKAWADKTFKQRLLADPKAVLQEEGISVPEGVEVRVVEETPHRHQLKVASWSSVRAKRSW